MEYKLGKQGLDVSFYQRIPAQNGQPAREIDFYRMKQYPIDFVIIRAGQGNHKDPGFDYNWQAAKQAGIPRGSYWFEDKDFSPESQAKMYWDLLKTDPGEGICAMDFENGSHTDLNSAYLFLSKFQQLSGLPDNKVAIYTGYPFWKNATTNAQRAWFSRFPLWLAWYTNNPGEVLVPFPWSLPTIWQNDTPSIGNEVGVQSKEVDHDYFNADLDFTKYFNQLTGGGTMPDVTYTSSIKSTVTLGAIVRATPNGADTGNRIAANTTVQITGQGVPAGGYTWYNIISPTVGWVADALLNPLVPVTPPPASTLPDTIYIATKSDMSDKTKYVKGA